MEVVIDLRRETEERISGSCRMLARFRGDFSEKKTKTSFEWETADFYDVAVVFSPKTLSWGKSAQHFWR